MTGGESCRSRNFLQREGKEMFVGFRDLPWREKGREKVAVGVGEKKV